MIKCIAFDFGGVLFTYENKKFIKELSQALGVSEKLVRKAWYFRLHEFETGKITEKEYWQSFLDVVNRTFDHTKLHKIFINQFNPINSTIEFAQKLSKKYIVSILSNQSIAMEELETKYSYRKLFSPCVISFQVGYMKPERNIFKKFIKLSKVNPDEIVFIDDIDFINVCNDVGINFIQYKDVGQLKRDLRKLGVKA